MPWPFVPPDPDMPAPLLVSRSNRISAVCVELRGMVPHEEQPHTEFRLGGEPAAVWVPHDLKEGYRYTGVLMGAFGHEPTTNLKAQWNGPVGGQGPTIKAMTLKLTPTHQWPGEIVDVSVGARGGKWVITVLAKAPKEGDHQIVVAPYAAKWPQLNGSKEYAEVGAWRSFKGHGKIDLEVAQNSTITQLAVFIARDFPKALTLCSEVFVLAP